MSLVNKKARTEQAVQAPEKSMTINTATSGDIVKESSTQTQEIRISFAGAGGLENVLTRLEGNSSGQIHQFDPAQLWTVEEDGSKSFEACGVKFFLDGDGVSYYSEREGERVRLCGPMRVLSEAMDEDGNDRHVIVEMVDKDGKRKRIAFPLADLPKFSIIETLLSKGLRIDVRIRQNNGPAGLILDFLGKYPQVKRTRAIHNFGWRGETAFIVPGRPVQIFGQSDENLEFEFVGNEEDGPQYLQKGTLEDWREKVALPATKSSRMAFALCVAFAAPLMRFTTEKTGGFHLFGPSSRGKSTALRACCSVWAKGASDGEMSSWRSTDNGLEAVAAAHNDLPLIIDELGQATPQNVDVAEVLYMLGNETGKKRMSRNIQGRRSLSWRTMFLSSGEMSLEEYAEEQARENRKISRDLKKGVRVRMASIPAVAYENSEDPRGVFDYVDEQEDTKSLSQAIEKATEFESYGTAGPAFVRGLLRKIEEEGRETLESEIQGKIREFCECAVGDDKDGQILRVANRFGLVAAAGELAIELDVLPWVRGLAHECVLKCYRAWRAGFENSAEERRRLVEWIEEEILSNGRHFKQVYRGMVTEESLAPCWGWQILDDDKKVERVYFIPGMFRKVFGTSALRVFPELEKAGRLMVKGKRSYQYESPMPDKEVETKRAYVIEMTASK